MNKHLIGSILGTLTTFLGFSFVGLSTLLAPLPSITEAYPMESMEINPCTLNSTSKAYLNRDIVVQATLYKYDEQILVYPDISSGLPPYSDCGVSDPLRGYDPSTFDPSIWTELDATSYVGPNSKLLTFFKECRTTKWEIDVEIQGVLLPNPYKKYAATYKLAPTKIKVVGQWRRFTPKGAD